MAERAVLARERSDGRFDVWSAQWGGTERVVAAVCAGRSPLWVPGTVWHLQTIGLEHEAVVETLDYLSTGALYRVQRGETTTFLPLWFGLPFSRTPSATTTGALVAVDSLAEMRHLREWFRRLKGSIAEALLAGDLPAVAGPLVLQTTLAALGGEQYYTRPWSPPNPYP